MKLDELVAKLIKDSRKNQDVAGGLFMLTVAHKAETFVGKVFPEAVVFDFKGIDTLRTARNISLRDRTDWPRVIVQSHNPHVLYTQEADISLHVWKEGDNYLARCTKLRGELDRPTEDWVLDHGVVV